MAHDRSKGWPKLLRDAEGMRVRLVRDTETGLARIPKGTMGTVHVHANGWHLLTFKADPCSCCGVAPRVTRMSFRDLEPIKESPDQ